MTDQVQSKVPDGKICYIEIPSNNIDESASFYANVFGWKIRTRTDKTVAFDDAPNGVSGSWILNRQPQDESGLKIYIMVNDVAATLKHIVEHGGKVVEPVSGTAPELLAAFSDLSGNIFGICQE